MIHRGLTRVAGKGNLLTLLRTIPCGRVTTFDMLAEELGQPAALVQLLLSALTEDEREIAPWHRVVAKGGAIGRGPHRDQQFARLIREGILVSPAGIVQDMPRFLVTTFEAASSVQQRPPEVSPDVHQPGHRSRGMKSRP
jgi:methylated-DNA-protein-cysteine methyltransferase-like protein